MFSNIVLYCPILSRNIQFCLSDYFSWFFSYLHPLFIICPRLVHDLVMISWYSFMTCPWQRICFLPVNNGCYNSFCFSIPLIILLTPITLEGQICTTEIKITIYLELNAHFTLNQAVKLGWFVVFRSIYENSSIWTMGELLRALFYQFVHKNQPSRVHFGQEAPELY